jgi:M6 family metalloprotease-like protein
MDVIIYCPKHLILPILMFSVFFAGAQPSFVPAAPYSVTVIQPDGTELDIRGIGDEHSHFTVTDDGYTVLKNKDGNYEFARLLQDGKLDLSGIRARNKDERGDDEKKYLNSLQKFLKEPYDQSATRLKSATTDSQNEFPSSGSGRALLLLIEYPNLNHTYTVNNFDNMMNQQNYNGTGSFTDYYYQASNGKLSLTVDVFGWYMAKNNYSYYGDENGDDRARELVAEVVDAAENAGVDFSDYDNDRDGYVDNLIVAHAGPGAEEGSKTEYVWSHSWSLGSFSRNYDGVTISSYIINPETRSYGMVGIGVFCHEFGHALGLPDLYDTDKSDGDSEGLGNWCLMATGGWLNQERTPAMLSAWARDELGWINPVVIDSEGDFSLTPAATGVACYKMLTPVRNEYFLLENRYPVGFDEALPGSGLAIFHINTSQPDNSDESLKLSDLEEADGNDDLDKSKNRGDNGDLFPGTSMNTVFNDNTYPDSKNYNDNPTGVNIYNIKKEGNLITFSTGAEAVHGIDLTAVTSSNKLIVDETLISVDMEVKNTGDQDSDDFKVAFYLSKDRSVSLSDIFTGSKTISYLNAGGSMNISFLKDVKEVNPVIEEGNYYVGYIIDYMNDITEISEVNNHYSFINPLVSIDYQSDLTFVAFRNHLELSSNRIDIFLELTNTGDDESPAGNIGFYMSDDLSLSTSDFFLGETEFPPVMPGDHRPCSFSFQISSLEGQVEEGNYYVGYIIDHERKITEIDEDNNSYIYSDDPFHYCMPDINFLSENLCYGDSLSFDGNIIKDSGVYEFEYKNFNGCDSLIVLEVTVNPVNDISLEKTICRGDSVMLSDIFYKDPGIYSANFSNIYGCDSAVILYLDVIEPVEQFISRSICSGDSAELAGAYYWQSGTYTHLLASSWGCDSTVIMELTVNQSSDTLLTSTVCEGDSVIFGDMALKETGVYSRILDNSRGCDSLVTLDLLVNDTDELVFNKTICSGDSAVIGSFVYKESGTYINTFPNQFGCDSTVILELNAVLPPYIDLGPDRIIYASEELFLDAGPGYASYNWSTGDNNQMIVVNSSAGMGKHKYEVTVANDYGCSTTDNVQVTLYDDSHLISDLERNLKIFPNPSPGIINLLIEQIKGKYSVNIYSESGTMVYRNDFTSPGKKFIKQIDLSFLATGIYTVHISSEDAQLSKNLIISGNR